MASIDPVAIDTACLDLIKKTKENGTQPFINQVNILLGENTINMAEKLGIGTKNYNFIDIDKSDNSGELISLTFN